MKTLNFRRWSNTIAAIILTVLFGYFFGSLSVWKDKQSEVAYPAEEFGQVVTYQVFQNGQVHLVEKPQLKVYFSD